MTLVDAVTAVVAGLLLCSGLGKLAVPGPAADAAVRLGVTGPAGADRWIRLVAGGETATAVALLPPATHSAGVVLAAGFGAGFVVVAVAGRLRRTAVPCGCFGRAAGRPLGWRNAATGAAVSVAAGWTLTGPPGPAATFTTAAVVVAMCGWLHRDLIRGLVRPARTGRGEPMTIGVH